MHNKGYIYTIVSLAFGTILLLLISLQYQSAKITTETEPSKIRTDELHYFVESMKKDLSRAMAISGRRGAVYLIDYMVAADTPYPNTTSALEEIIMNATILNNSAHQNVTYMRNHTINFWLNRTKEAGEEIHFEVNMTPLSINIYPYDHLHFLQIITINTTITDNKGVTGRPMCTYQNPRLRIYSIASIDGIEDPFYPPKTENKVRRYYNGQTTPIPAHTIALAQYGSGMGGGEILDLRNTTSSQQLNEAVILHSLNYPEKLGHTVFIINTSNFGILNTTSRQIINNSGGLINENDTDYLGGLGFPYIAGIENINYSYYKYVVIRNGLNHSLLYLGIADDLKNNTYYSSTEGASFFDRLEGRLNLTETYINRSRDGRIQIGVNTTQTIGLEGFANASEFAYYELYENGILPEYANQTATDYKYFANKTGQQIYGTPTWFRLDAAHIGKYNITEYAYDPNYTGVWHLNEGTGASAYDDTKKPTTGTINGATWTNGIQGNALDFSDGDYVDCGNSPTLTLGPSMTVSAWIKPEQNSGVWARIVGKGNTTHRNYGLFRQDDGDILWQVYGTTINNCYNDAGPGDIMNVPNGVWVQVAGTYDGANMVVYINGSRVKTCPATGTPTTTTSPLQIGKLESIHYYTGLIDEVKIYNRALSDYEILEEYNKFVE